MHLNQRTTTQRAMAKAEANLAEGLLGAIPRVGSRGIRVSETPVLRGYSLELRPSPPVSRHRCLLRHRCRLRQCRRRPLAATDRRRRRHPTAMNTTADAAFATTPATIVTAAAAAAVIVVAAPAAPCAGAEADVVPSRRAPLPPPLPCPVPRAHADAAVAADDDLAAAAADASDAGVLDG